MFQYSKILFYHCFYSKVITYFPKCLKFPTKNPFQTQLDNLRQLRSLTVNRKILMPLFSSRSTVKSVLQIISLPLCLVLLALGTYWQRPYPVIFPYAAVSVASAILAILLGFIGLRLITGCSKRVKRNPQKLYDIFRSVRFQLVHINALFLMCIFMSAGTWGALWLPDEYVPSFGFYICISIILAGGWLTIKFEKTAFLQPKEWNTQLIAKNLEPAQAPLLWKFLEEISKKGNLPLPDYVLVGLAPSFFVTNQTMILGENSSLPRGRKLYLSASFMQFLDRKEIATIIAHELAHLAHSDNDESERLSHLSEQFSAMSDSLTLFIDSDKEASLWQIITYYLAKPAFTLCTFFCETFAVLIHQARREDEVRADEVAKKVVDARTSATTLIRIHALFPLLNDCFNRFFYGVKQTNITFSDFVMQNLEISSLNPEDFMLHETTHRFDTHPTTLQRLEALGIEPDQEIIRHALRKQKGTLLQELGM